MGSPWTLLPAAKSSLQSLPQLLIRHSFQSDSYSISLTDLTRVWSEALRRRDIIKRALNENTSIDPTEDSTQLHVLLETIKKPLVGVNGVLELASSSYHTILLRVTAKLPPPLNSLSWTYQLTLAPESSIRHEIIAPIWALAYKQHQEIEDLLRRLRERDHVISKLLDSVDNSNTDLSTIFPSTAGMKMPRDSSRREQAMQHVPGLAAFDEEAWQEEFDQKDSRFTAAVSSSIALTEVNAAMFESLCKRSEAINYGAEWWTDLGRLPAELPQIPDTLPPMSVEKKVPISQVPQGFEDDDETESEDEYQKQPTPPHLRAQKLVPPDHNVEQSRSPATAQSEVQTEICLESPARKLGRIGGRSKTPQALLEVSGAYSSTEATARSSPSEGESTSKGPVRKLGRIGGMTDKAKVVDASSDRHMEAGQSKETTSGFSSPATKDSPHQRNNLPSDKSPSVVLANRKDDASPIKEESTEEAANRKRQELRRKLEAQELTANKKKRRF